MKFRGSVAYRAALGGNVPEAFVISCVNAFDFLSHEMKDSRFHFFRGLGCFLFDNANQIADQFLGEWVLFLDVDHVFSSDAFYEMATTFEENNLDILTGFAQKRQPPYLPIIMKTNFDPLVKFDPIIPGPIEKHTLIPIDAAGLACVMVRRKVFDKIKTELNELPFDFRMKFAPGQEIPKDRRHDEHYAEDISFFWRAKLLGFQAWCAPWIKFHHVETRLVTDDMMQIEKPSPVPQ